MRGFRVITGIVGLAVGVAALVVSGGNEQVDGAQQMQVADEVKPVPPTPIAIKKAELDQPTWDPAWGVMIERALPGDLLSSSRAREVGALCPRFRHLNKGQRRAFWAYFFQALAGAEAGMKPTADVHHTGTEVDVTDDVTHRPVHQEGLLQLTYMDSQRYGCDFDWEKDKDLAEHDPQKTILQPMNNLLCGINILENQLVTRHEPLLSNQSYWSTLRPDNASLAVFKKQMANVPAYCGLGTRPVEARPAPTVETENQPPKANQVMDQSAGTANAQWNVKPTSAVR
jgi:hypothetical protein